MVDLVVHGAGVLGLTVAWEAAKRGLKVCISDPNGIAGMASGGIVGALAPHVPENWNSKKQFQFQSLINAERFWNEVDLESGLDSGYSRLGRLQPIDDEKALLLARNRLESSKHLWCGLAKWQIVDNSGAWSLTSRTKKWVFDNLSARINPIEACFSLACAIEKRGGLFEMDSKKYENVKTVWATGVHDLDLISKFNDVNFRTAVKGQAALFNFKCMDYPQLFANSIHFVPHSNGTLAVGSTSENDYSSPNATDYRLENLIENSREVIPELRQIEPIKRWADVRPRSETRAPIVGNHPVMEGDYIINGGFKIGFGMAPELARVLIGLIFDGTDEIPDAFKPNMERENIRLKNLQ